MILGIDISHWQDQVDFELLRAEGVEFCVVKATQGDYKVDDHFAQHTDGAATAGMRVGAYHWNDPMCSDSGQAALFLDTIKDTPVRFVMPDVEQYWQDWVEWSKRAITKIISPARIEQNARYMLQACKWSYPTVLYTRLSFIYDYARGILNWVNSVPTMWAQYPYAKGRVAVSWDAFKTQLPDVSKLKLPPGANDWRFWQFTGDKFLLPGVLDENGKPSALDVIFWNGSLEELDAWIGGATPEPQQGSKLSKMRVGVPKLNIRSGPGLQYPDIGDLFGNQVVEVYNVAGPDAWVEIAPGQWACAQKGHEQYLVKVEE